MRRKGLFHKKVYRFFDGIVESIAGSTSAFSLRNRIYNAVILLALVTSVLSIFWNAIAGLEDSVNESLYVALIVFSFFYYFGRFRKTILADLFVIVSLITLIFLYLMSDGIYGSTPYLLILVTLMYTAIGKENRVYWYLGLTLLVLFALVYIDLYHREDLITEYPSSEVKVNDLIFSLIFSIITAFGLLYVFGTNYESERRLNQKQKKELERQSKIKDKLYSIISHDIRSPLQSIVAFTQLIGKNQDQFTPEELSGYMEELNVNAEKTLDLLDNLLSWSNMQQKKIVFKIQSVEVLSFINSLLDRMVYLSSINRVVIKLDIDKSHNLKADPQLLELIIKNLLSNANKFTPSGGIITISSKSNGEFVEVSVKDTGIGISKEIMAKLFKESDSVGRKGLMGEKSTGLGLILCKEFVEMQGGKIRVESEIDNGSNFIISLPKA